MIPPNFHANRPACRILERGLLTTSGSGVGIENPRFTGIYGSALLLRLFTRSTSSAASIATIEQNSIMPSS